MFRFVERGVRKFCFVEEFDVRHEHSLYILSLEFDFFQRSGTAMEHIWMTTVNRSKH